MAGRTRTKKNATQKTYRDAMTQTSPEQTNTEINRLKEEVHLLRQELNQLKPKRRSNVATLRQREEVTVVAVADSPQAQKVPIKGCTCKGKCASRVCGCVKKKTACTAVCKCEHAKCTNQAPNKENISINNAQAQISSEVEISTKRLSTLKLRKNLSDREAQEVAGPSKKEQGQAGKSWKSLFSPESPQSHRREFSVNKLECHTPIVFGDAKRNVRFNSDSSPEERQKTKPKQIWINTRQRLAVETSVQANKKPNSDGSKKKKLISPYYDGRKSRALSNRIEDIKGFNSSLDLETIDPMKPTHQLQRTPVLETPQRSRSKISESPRVNVEPVEVKKQSILLPPDGIDEPVVNWEEHCAQLVPCRLCSRTFYPYRLDKHEASCKKI